MKASYTLRSNLLGDRLQEEITIETDTTISDIEGDLYTLRRLAFEQSAGESFYKEILSRTRTAKNDLAYAQQGIEEMRAEWHKASEFLTAQGLSKAIPKFPIKEKCCYDNPALQASTHISGLNDF